MSIINSSYSIFSMKIAGAGFSFLVSVLFMQASSSEELGKYSLATTLIVLLSTIAAFGQNIHLMRFITNHEKVEAAKEKTRTLAFCLTLVAISLPLAFSAIQGAYTEALAFFLPLYIYNVICQVKSPILLTDGRFFLNSLYDDFLRPFWGVVFVSSMIAAKELAEAAGSPALSSSLATGSLITIAILFIIRIFPNHGKIEIQHIKEIEYKKKISTSAPAVAISILGILISQFDRIYTPFILGYKDAGLYYAAQTLVLVINYFNQSLITRKTPELIKAYQEKNPVRLHELAKNSTRKSIKFSLITISAFIVAIPILEKLLNYSGYEFWGVTLILLSSQTLSLLFGFGSSLMLYGENSVQKKLMTYLLIAFLAGAIIGAALASAIGVLGAAIGTGIGIIINRALPFYFFKKNGFSLGAL